MSYQACWLVVHMSQLAPQLQPSWSQSRCRQLHIIGSSRKRIRRRGLRALRIPVGRPSFATVLCGGVGECECADGDGKVGDDCLCADDNLGDAFADAEEVGGCTTDEECTGCVGSVDGFPDGAVGDDVADVGGRVGHCAFFLLMVLEGLLGYELDGGDGCLDAVAGDCVLAGDVNGLGDSGVEGDTGCVENTVACLEPC